MMATEIFFAPGPEKAKNTAELAKSYPDYPKLHTRIPSESEGRKPSAILHSHDRTRDNFSPTKTHGEGGV